MTVRGSDIVVGLYDEVTYNSTSGIDHGVKAYFTELSVVASRTNIQPNTLTGDRSRAIPGQGNLDVSGNLNVEIAPENVGFLLRHAIGEPATTGNGPYTHTFRPGTLPVGMAIEKDWTSVIASKVELFTGCRVGQATIDVPQEGAATMSLSINGADYTVGTAPIDAALDDPGHSGFFASDVTVKVGGNTTTCVRQASISINNNLDTGRYCIGGAGKRKDLPEGFADVTGSITALFEAFTLVDAATARTDTSLEILMTKGTGAGTAGNESLSVKLDHALVELASPAITSPGGVEVTFNFTAYKSGATDKGLVVVLKNALEDTDGSSS